MLVVVNIRTSRTFSAIASHRSTISKFEQISNSKELFINERCENVACYILIVIRNSSAQQILEWVTEQVCVVKTIPIKELLELIDLLSLSRNGNN